MTFPPKAAPVDKMAPAKGKPVAKAAPKKPATVAAPGASASPLAQMLSGMAPKGSGC